MQPFDSKELSKFLVEFPQSTKKPAIILIAGMAGLTEAIDSHVANLKAQPHTDYCPHVKVTVPRDSTVKSLILAILESLGEKPSRKIPLYQLVEIDLAKTLHNQAIKLIIFDKAERLSHETLDILCNIQKMSGCTLAFLGSPKVMDAIKRYKPLYNRVVIPYLGWETQIRLEVGLWLPGSSKGVNAIKRYKSFSDRVVIPPFQVGGTNTVGRRTIYAIDHTLLDIQIIENQNQPGDDGNRIRAFLTVVQETNSGRLLAWTLDSEQPDSSTMYTTLMKALLEGGIPDVIYIDNSENYIGNDFHKLGVTLGIEQVSCKHQIHAKGGIERFFSDLNNNLLAALNGALTLAGKNQNVSKPGIHSFAELNQAVQQFINIYHQKVNT